MLPSLARSKPRTPGVDQDLLRRTTTHDLLSALHTVAINGRIKWRRSCFLRLRQHRASLYSGAIVVADHPVRNAFCVLNKDGTGISYGLLLAFDQLHDFFRNIVSQFKSKDAKSISPNPRM